MQEGTVCVELYSTKGCEPCKALKEWLSQYCIGYREIQTQDLRADEIECLAKKILSVSRIDKPTVPAVKITISGKEFWISNHGKADITEMIEEIRAVLKV